MESSDLLAQGISAAKAGKKGEARRLLTQVVRADSNNERAWLWLSGLVGSAEDRLLCLENVLSLNPENELAHRGLERLGRNRAQQGMGGQSSAASGTLSSLGQDMASRGDAVSPDEVRKSGPSVANAYADVWTTDDDICAFCAHVVKEGVKACAHCGRSLVKKEYRYPATVALHFFWVVLVGLSVTLTFQSLFQLRLVEDGAMAILYAGIAAVLLLLVVGIYARLFLAHVVSVFVLILVMVLSIASFFQLFEPEMLGPSSVDPAIFGIAGEFMGRLTLLLKIVQLAVATIALFYALFKVAPEFDRVTVSLFARSRKGLHTAVDYHMTARRLAKEGMWASAILHWQRAAAIEPGAIVYQRSLANAYLRLGFYERAYGILKHVQELPMRPDTKAEIARLMNWAQQKLAVRAKVA